MYANELGHVFPPVTVEFENNADVFLIGAPFFQTFCCQPVLFRHCFLVFSQLIKERTSRGSKQMIDLILLLLPSFFYFSPFP